VREPKRQIHTSSTDTPSLREVFGYIAAHKKMFLLAFIGFSGFTIAGYAFQFWGPTFFMRVHGFSPAKAGIMFGLSFGILGTLGIIIGGLWSDRWVAKGHPDAFARVARWAAALQLASFVPAYLVSDGTIAAIFFCIGMFGNCLIGGLQGAMIQAITPNRMRGMMSAIYGTLMNVTGLGIIPPITAALSDRVFHGNLGPALAVTAGFGLLLVLVLVTLALKSLRARVEAIQGG
jgi:MFS family permease